MSSVFLLLQSGSAGSFLVTIFPFVLIFGVFYFLVIVPQRKRQRELQETIQQLKAGDRIVTTGGVIGVITQVKDSSLLLRSADKSILEVTRTAVAGLDQEQDSK
jgi:preprotein translocase subunit YajC